MPVLPQRCQTITDSPPGSAATFGPLLPREGSPSHRTSDAGCPAGSSVRVPTSPVTALFSIPQTSRSSPFDRREMLPIQSSIESNGPARLRLPVGVPSLPNECPCRFHTADDTSMNPPPSSPESAEAESGCMSVGGTTTNSSPSGSPSCPNRRARRLQPPQT